MKFSFTCLLSLILARACAAKGYCSRSGRSVCRSVGRLVSQWVSRLVGRWVGRSVFGLVCPHVFSRTVAAVDTKRVYTGMCNGRSAQQESGAAFSKNSMFTAGA